MPNPDLSERIRAIFLHPKDRVTIAEAAEMLGWTRAEMNAAIRDGDIETLATASGSVVELRELAEQALQRWSLAGVEDALGRDAGRVIPPALRTRERLIRLPAYEHTTLEILADEGRESVDALLDRTVNEIARNARHRLEPRIPGLAEALDWPGGWRGAAEG